MKRASKGTGWMLWAGLLAVGLAPCWSPVAAQTGFCARDCLGSFLGCLQQEGCRAYPACERNERCTNNTCPNGDRCGRSPDGCGAGCDGGLSTCLDSCGPTYFVPGLVDGLVALDPASQRPLVASALAADLALHQGIDRMVAEVSKHLETYRARLRAAKGNAAGAAALEGLALGIESALKGGGLQQCVSSLTNPGPSKVPAE